MAIGQPQTANNLSRKVSTSGVQFFQPCLDETTLVSGGLPFCVFQEAATIAIEDSDY